MNRKRSRFLISNILIFILIISCAMHVYAGNTSDISTGDGETITEAYDFPIKPGSDEWRSFNSRMEKIEACQIPDLILSKMTTKALVDTVMNYPLLIDMVVRDTAQEGFEAILEVFNGLQVLVKRPDVLSEFSNYQECLKDILIESKEITLKKIYIGYMLVGIGAKKINPDQIDYSMGTVYTPHGTAVSTFYNLIWSDHHLPDGTPLTAYLADVGDDQLQLLYPNAVHLREEYPSYNCHSYAWYSTSATNKHWMDSPSAYMTDGSYTQCNALVNSKVYYGSTADHSGRVVYVGGYNVGVYSKWGWAGLYSHNIIDCPYTEYSYNCTFWH